MPLVWKSLVCVYLAALCSTAAAQDMRHTEPFPSETSPRAYRESDASGQPRRLSVAPARAMRPASLLPIPMQKARQDAAAESASHQTPFAQAAPDGEPTVTDRPMKLSPRSRSRDKGVSSPGVPSLGKSLTTVVGSLAVVLTLFFVVVWLTRRKMPKAVATLPEEVVEVLGRAPLASRQYIHLVRIGQKLILLSITPTGTETLTEITDPVEVDRLASLCQQDRPGSVTATFRQVLSQLGSEPAPAGFLGDGRRSDLEIANTPPATAGRGTMEDAHA